MNPSVPPGEDSDLRSELFKPTDWQVVELAGQANSTEAAGALEQLCRTYWYPLYAYVRRRGYNAQEAQDLTQEFLLHLLEKNYLAHADRQKGRFRSFLLAALNHFLTSEWRRGQTAKRGGKGCLLSLDDDTAEIRYALEPVSDLTPERIYERRWALTLLDQALGRLRDELAADGKARQFDLLQGFLTDETETNDYERVAAQLEMKPGAVAVAVHRLRQRYHEMVRQEVSRTVGNPAEVEEEIRWLLAAAS
jgi:RNA polymerase sigma-70 factor (ECF subfamily)